MLDHTRQSSIITPEASAYRESVALWPFDLPFPPARISPDQERVATRSHRWVRRMGLLAGEAERARFEKKMPLWACMNYPDAAGPELDLVSDWVCWWATWNDLLDDPDFTNSSRKARAFFRDLISVIESDTKPAPALGQKGPSVAAFVDIWRRWCHRMSHGWKVRAAKNWIDFFNGFIELAGHKRTGTELDLNSYLKLRDMTGGVYLELDVAERVGRYEVPARILESTVLEAMRLDTVRVVNITQDVQSLTKEELAGEKNNIVLVLERGEHVGREESLASAHRMVRKHTDDFLHQQATVPCLLDELSVPVSERNVVYKYIADLAVLMAADVAWCATVDRYTG